VPGLSGKHIVEKELIIAVKKEFISEGRNYELPLIYDINGNEKTVCVIVHGFGSSKESFMAKKLLEELPLHGIGAIAFDHPAHGESAVDGAFLRINNSLMDLSDTEDRARNLAPGAEIVYFASSFGAYIALIYLAGKKLGKRRAFLRAAAVSMPRFVERRLTPEQKAMLEKEGEIILDKEEYGYIRDLKVVQGFFDDLASHDVFEIWRKGLADLHMVHGDADITVPLGDVRDFSDKFNVPLTVIPNGDHQLSIPGAPEQVLKHAVEFFLR